MRGLLGYTPLTPQQQLAPTTTTPQALIDGPSTSVPRQPLPYRSLILTPYTLPSLPRAAGTGPIRAAFDKADVQSKWEGSSWSKKLVAREVRRQASDFERFEVGLAKRQRREQVRPRRGRGCRRKIGRCFG